MLFSSRCHLRVHSSSPIETIILVQRGPNPANHISTQTPQPPNTPPPQSTHFFEVHVFRGPTNAMPLKTNQGVVRLSLSRNLKVDAQIWAFGDNRMQQILLFNHVTKHICILT